jgi:hypothetical protein
MTPTADFLHYELALERARRISAERVVFAELYGSQAHQLARLHEDSWVDRERQLRPHETSDFRDDE